MHERTPCRLSSWKFVVRRMSSGEIDVANGCTVRSSRHDALSIPQRSSTPSENRNCAFQGKWPRRHESSIGSPSETVRIIGTSALLIWSKIALTSAVVIPGS